MTHGAWGIGFPWVMGRTIGLGGPSPWVMGHTIVSTIFILHGSWSVRQTISSWVMECTPDHLSQQLGLIIRKVGAN